MTSPPPLELLLVEPTIPPNTGNVARLAAALGVPLGLVEPLGFDVSEKAVRRAGLDYWEHVQLAVYPDWEACVAARPGRLVYTSAFAEQLHTELVYEPGDRLVFGKETSGLDPRLWAAHPGALVRIPHWGPVRSLNLANAVAVVAYEAMRQLAERGLVPPAAPRPPDRPPATPYEHRKRGG